MAPLDEFGIPKYKGKKRGRKPRKRIRQRNPNTPKRKHTAYTLFVQENYPAIRQHNPNLQSKDVISIVAKQWATVPDEEKRTWREHAKAAAAKDESEEARIEVDGVPAGEVVAAGVAAGVVDAADVEDEECEDEDTEEEEDQKEVLETTSPSSRSKKAKGPLSAKV
mmetsp:Transcript_38044/g.77629  ORF Transcript_38044/g.77629 Transcript_38044/m.77629 type:complete len:166 (-) Transcript_38044:358-855(-)